jgi:hypothetical protein
MSLGAVDCATDTTWNPVASEVTLMVRVKRWRVRYRPRHAPNIGILILGLACGTDRPTAPSAVPAAPMAAAPIPQPPQPPPAGEPVAIYAFYGPLDYPISGFTPGSQYLLYDNEVFGLRYDAFPHVYLGTYRHDNATITFRFDNAWTWEEGGKCLSDSRPTGGICPFAIGTLNGDFLEVRYGDSMKHSDFENAVYRRSQ